MAHIWRNCGFLVILFLLGSCAGSSGGGSSASGLTTVVISLPGTVAGAITTIPASIQSFRVDALQNSVVVATASATLPNSSVQMTVANGIYQFRLVALDANGIAQYQGLSSAYTLTGLSVAIPITLTGVVAVTPSTVTVNPGDIQSFSATFSHAAPTAANPLIWSATGGSITFDSATFGASATWIAPTTPGTYTVIAKVNPAVNAQQLDNGSGHVSIVVKDVTAPAIIPASAHFSLPEPVAGFGVSLLTPTLGSQLQSWLNGATALDNADGFITVTHSTLPTSFALGDTTVDFYATDAAGNQSTLSTTVTVYTPSTTTFKAQDTLGNPIANISIGGIATGTQSAVRMVDTAGNAITDASGLLTASLLNAAETYLLLATAPKDNYADGFWSGAQGNNVVSTYSMAGTFNNAANTTITLVMSPAGHIAGQVLDSNGAAIPYARVDYSPSPYDDLGTHFTTFANASGAFSAGVETGSYQVLATGTVLDSVTGIEHALTTRLSGGLYAGGLGALVSPYANQAATIAVSQGTTQTISMKLVAGGTIAGRVYDSGGNPVTGMRVNIEPYGVTANPRAFEAVTDISGLYQLNVPQGRYRLIASNKKPNPVFHIEQSLSAGLVGGYSAGISGAVTRDAYAAVIHAVPLGGQRIVDMTLLQGGIIQGTVTGVPYVRIFAQDTTTGDTQQIFANAFGKYTLNMVPGTVRLVVDSYSMDPVSGQLVALKAGLAGGYVDATGVAQSLSANAQGIAVTAGGTVTQNITLNVGTLFDAAAVVGTFIP